MEEFLFIIGLILLNGLFSMSEVALISARKTRLTTEAEKGNLSAKAALKLTKEPNLFLSTVQIGITLIGILTGIYSGNKIAQQFTAILEEWSVNSIYAHYIAQCIIVIIVTYLTILFGELLPKRIGMSYAESVARIVARPMLFLSHLAYPCVLLLSRSTTFVYKMIGMKENDTKVTEEEIKTMIQEGAEDGEVQPMEQDIMQRVLMIGDLNIGSIMTHKSDIVWLDIQMTADDVRKVISEDIYEFYPIADGDLDHVKGIISLKDLVLHLHESDFSLEPLVHEPVYFHENMEVYSVLEQMKLQKVSRALICDEFGTCVGILTVKDILDALVGNIDDSTEEPEIVKRINGNGWLVDGKCAMIDFLNYFKKFDLLEEEDFHTIGGLIMNSLDKMPQIGETVEWCGFKFEVVDMDGARIDKVLVEELPQKA